MAERHGAKIYNSAVTIPPDGRPSVYRKAHLFDRERLVFDVATPRFRAQRGEPALGVMICFDWIFPEVCPSLALDGARVILHPSHLRRPCSQNAPTTPAIGNRLFPPTGNRLGSESWS